jgi:hypothetical protein
VRSILSTLKKSNCAPVVRVEVGMTRIPEKQGARRTETIVSLQNKHFKVSIKTKSFSPKNEDEIVNIEICAGQV